MLANNLTPSNTQNLKTTLENVKGSNRRYKNKLQERMDAQNEDMKSRKRKQLLHQIHEIAKKKSLLLTSTEKDIKRSDVLSLQAEAEKDFPILHMSNSLKELVKQKLEELSDLSEQEKNLKHKSSLD